MLRKFQLPFKLSKESAFAGLAVILLALPAIIIVSQKNQNTTVKASTLAVTWPTTPPAQICGNTALLSGPSTPPAGAVTVPAGDNENMHFEFRAPNKTFWFAPGIHTLGNSEYGQIAPGSGTTFIGAPGAIIDGQRISRFAFTKLPDSASNNVTIRYLTIRNFVSPLDQGVVNHDSQKGWVMEYNTIQNNEGAGVFAATDNVLRYNCLADNGQYGFQAYSGNTDEVGPSHITIDHNEVARNNTGDWETKTPGCGCTGGAKFWLSNDTTVTNNWVHDNNSVGLWFDNNNRGAFIENNLIENNASEGVFLEAGYDAQVRNNLFKRNAIVKGRAFQGRGDPFPISALYISDNGAPAGYGLKYVPLIISNNSFEDNWGGVGLWENADRYSGSTAHTHISGTIKIGDLQHDTQCKSGTPNDIPDNLDPFVCRWSTENIIVENNEFRIDKAAIGTGCAGGNFCGISGIFANVGSYPEFSGYQIPWRVTFQQNNIFRNNHYFGDWKFAGFQTTKPDGSRVTWAEWTAPAPAVPATFTHANRPTTFGQDAGSIYNGGSVPTNEPGAPTATPVPTVPSGSGGSVGGPTTPQNLHTTGITSSSVGLAWSSSTDSVSPVTGYEVKRNGAAIGTTGGTGIIDNSVTAGQTYTYTVEAYSDSDNYKHSAPSAPLTVTIPGGATSIPTATPKPAATATSAPVSSINAIDANTAGLENGTGKWKSWFSTNIASSNDQAHSGNKSLKIKVTAPNGWGVQLANWPGFAATAGNKTISFWGIKDPTANVGVTMRVEWFNANRQLLKTDQITISSLTNTWQQAVANVTAPTGTATVNVTFTNQGKAGTILYLDDIFVSK